MKKSLVPVRHLTILISVARHRALRLAAARAGVTMTALIIDALKAKGIK